MQLDRSMFDGMQAADTGRHSHADARCIFFRHFQPGVAQGLRARGDAVVDERIHLLDVLGRNPVARIEIADLTGNARGIGGRVEMGDFTDTADALEDVVPGAGEVVANRRNNAHAGYYHTSFAHLIFPFGVPRRPSQTTASIAAAPSDASRPSQANS